MTLQLKELNVDTENVIVREQLGIRPQYTRLLDFRQDRLL